MCGKFIAVRVGMGIMAWRECRFVLRVVRGMGVVMVERVVPVLFGMAFLVLAGVQGKVVCGFAAGCFGFVSRWHTVVLPLLPDKSAEGTRSFHL